MVNQGPSQTHRSKSRKVASGILPNDVILRSRKAILHFPPPHGFNSRKPNQDHRFHQPQRAICRPQQHMTAALTFPIPTTFRPPPLKPFRSHKHEPAGVTKHELSNSVVGVSSNHIANSKRLADKLTVHHTWFEWVLLLSKTLFGRNTLHSLFSVQSSSHLSWLQTHGRHSGLQLLSGCTSFTISLAITGTQVLSSTKLFQVLPPFLLHLIHCKTIITGNGGYLGLLRP